MASSSSHQPTDVVSITIPRISENEQKDTSSSATTNSSASSDEDTACTKRKLHLQKQLKKLEKKTKRQRTVVVNADAESKTTKQIAELKTHLKKLQRKVDNISSHLKENYCTFCKRGGHKEENCRRKASSRLNF